jgi:hypothetical protein
MGYYMRPPSEVMSATPVAMLLGIAGGSSVQHALNWACVSCDVACAPMLAKPTRLCAAFYAAVVTPPQTPQNAGVLLFAALGVACVDVVLVISRHTYPSCIRVAGMPEQAGCSACNLARQLPTTQPTMHWNLLLTAGGGSGGHKEDSRPRGLRHILLSPRGRLICRR